MDNQFDFHLNRLKKLLEQRIVEDSNFRTELSTLRTVSQRFNNKAAEETIRVLELALSLPRPLAVTVSEYAVETNPFVKLHRLTDTAEIITRFIATIMLSDLFSQRRTFPSMIRQALLEKIERPTFGAWKDLLDLTNQALKTECFVPGFPAFIKNNLLPALGSGEGDHERELIALRNLLAHQGRITDARALELLSLQQQTFESLIDALSFLSCVDFIASDAAGKIISLQGLFEKDSVAGYRPPPELAPLLKPERVIIVRGEDGLDLFPLQIFGDVMRWRNDNLERITGRSIQIYLRFNGKGLIEYTTFTDQAALSQRDGDALQRFRQIYKLDDWRRLAREDKERSRLVFDELVDALLELFVGRDEQVAYVKQKVKSTSNGLLWLTGKPGIGKSALMARLTRDYRGAVQHYLTIPYFFAAGHAGCSVDEFIRTSLLLFNKASDEPVIPNLDVETKRSQFIETAKRLAATVDKKILFLIDGLDEIQRLDPGFLALVLASQGTNIVWLCAGRDESGITDSLLRSGATPVFPEGLPPMGAKAIRAMLTGKVDRMKYQLFDRDQMVDGTYSNPFVEALVQKSEGLPLYVHIAIEDLRSGKWSFNDEHKLPHGLSAYFDRILERLRMSDVGSVMTPLFCLLAWAKEPLDEPLLRRLLIEHHLKSDPEWADLVRQAMTHGHLMFRNAATPEGKSGLTLYHDSFRGYLLKSIIIEKTRAWAQRTWLDYCARWSTVTEGNSYHYAFRNYPAHLHEAKQWADLFALARDQQFLKAQRSVLPDNPELVLNTFSNALLGAAEVENAALMSEFLIARATEALAIVREAPLEALRTGRLKRARIIADLYDPPNCAIWHLLLAWKLIEAGQKELAAETIDRLLAKNMVEVFSTQGDALIELLIVLMNAKVTHWIELASRLLSENSRVTLIERLVSMGELADATNVLTTVKEVDRWPRPLTQIAELHAKTGDSESAASYFQQAIAAAEKFDDASFRVKIICRVAESQSRTGNQDAARQTLLSVFEVAKNYRYVPDGPVPYRYRDAEYVLTAWPLEELGRVQARIGEVDDALETAREIKADSTLRASVLREIATHHAKGNQWDVAESFIQEAIETEKKGNSGDTVSLRSIVSIYSDAGNFERAFFHACRIGDPWERSLSLRDIASAQENSGDRTSAASTLAKAIAAASEIKDQGFRSSARAYIAELQSQTSSIAEAMETIGTIEDASHRTRALKAVARHASANMKEILRVALDSEFKIALAADPESKRYRLEEIAEAWIETGDFRRASDTIRETNNADAEAKIFLQIAAVYLQRGDHDKAQNYFAAMIESTHKVDVDSLRAKALIDVAKLQGRQDRIPQSQSTFSAVLELVPLLSRVDDILQTLTETATAQARINDFDAAIETTNLISDKAAKAKTLSAIAVIAAQKGFSEISCTLFQSAIDVTPRDKDNILRDVAVSQAQVGQFTEAFATVEKIASPFYYSQTLVLIAQKQVRTNYIKESEKTLQTTLEMLSRFEPSRDKEMVVATVAEGYASVGDFRKALDIALKMEDKRHQITALSKIAELQARVPDENERETLAIATKTADSLSSGLARHNALREIGTAYARIGDFAVATAMGIDNSDSRALSEIAKYQFYSRDFESALATLSCALQATKTTRWHALDGGSYQLNEIAEVYAEFGYAEDAVRTAEIIPIRNERYLRRVTSALIKGGHKTEIRRLLILLSSNVSTAFMTCGLLAELYPEQADKIAQVLTGSNLVPTDGINQPKTAL